MIAILSVLFVGVASAPGFNACVVACVCAVLSGKRWPITWQCMLVLQFRACGGLLFALHSVQDSNYRWAVVFICVSIIVAFVTAALYKQLRL